MTNKCTRIRCTSVNFVHFMSVIFLFTLVFQSAANAQRYTFVDLGLLPGGIESHGEAINELGQIAGFADDENGLYKAYTWNNGVMTDIGTLGGPSARAYGINNSGQITGWADNDRGHQHAYIWDNGVMTDLGTLSTDESLSMGRRINEQGLTVGSSDAESGLIHAFFYNGADMLDLGVLGDRFSLSWGRDLNEFNQVVGASQLHISGPSHAFIWENDTLTDIGTLGGTTSQANGINDMTQIVGFAYNADEYSHAFMWEDGVMTDLGTFGGTESHARELNENGDIVGYAFTPEENKHAFLYMDNILYDLNYMADVPNGYKLQGARDINDSGQIVGTAIYEGNFRAYTLIPRDDPFTLSASPLIGGESGTFNVTGAKPNTKIWLAYSIDGIGWSYNNRLSAALHLIKPMSAGNAIYTDANGAAEWNLAIPDVNPRPVWLQAAQRNIVSNVVVTEIQ